MMEYCMTELQPLSCTTVLQEKNLQYELQTVTYSDKAVAIVAVHSTFFQQYQSPNSNIDSVVEKYNMIIYIAKYRNKNHTKASAVCTTKHRFYSVRTYCTALMKAIQYFERLY